MNPNTALINSTMSGSIFFLIAIIKSMIVNVISLLAFKDEWGKTSRDMWMVAIIMSATELILNDLMRIAHVLESLCLSY